MHGRVKQTIKDPSVWTSQSEVGVSGFPFQKHLKRKLNARCLETGANENVQESCVLLYHI